jgi:hypothetical protein
MAAANDLTDCIDMERLAAGDWAKPIDLPQITVEGDGVTQKMGTHVGRDGSCAGCHVDPQGPTSPGRVYLHEAPK